MRKFTCDFETTTDPDDCRVWAWALCEIGKPENFIYGNDITELFEWCYNQRDNVKLFFHNLKFDGVFICNFLEEANFKFVPDRKYRDEWTYTTLITDMGQWFSIEVWFEVQKKKAKKVTICDSLKLLNFSVEEIAKSFNLPIRKLDLDYETYRPIGHELTPHEVDYIRNDVEIMARALDLFFKEIKPKLTMASTALASYKETNPNFRNDFPQLPIEVDDDIRASYKGGFTYLNPIYRNVITRGGYVLDYNSLYPSILYYMPLPYQIPEPFEGKYVPDPLYPLYTQMINCTFKLKPGKIPTIQIKNTFGFMPNEYLETSDDGSGLPVTLVLTKPDLELFLEHYDVEDLEYVSGWKFKCATGLFCDYIDYWMEKKIEAKKQGLHAQLITAKLAMNSIYGKFATNPHGSRKMPVINSEDGIMDFINLPEETRPPVYVALAAFVTAYGRKRIIEAAQSVRDWSLKTKGYDAYVYSDTDSLHILVGEEDLPEIKKFLDIDDYRLGALKIESQFLRGKYLRAKSYIEEQPDGSMNVTVAGLPKKFSSVVNFDNFRPGFHLSELPPETLKDLGMKLNYTYVKGGVILTDTDFTIL